MVSVFAAAEALGAAAVRLSAAVGGIGAEGMQESHEVGDIAVGQGFDPGRSGDRVGRWTMPLR